MLYPQNGTIANGSRRRLPTAPAAAAVVSEPMIDPRNTPCCQLYASVTSGTVLRRRPPKRMAEIGTAFGSPPPGGAAGPWREGGGKGLFGWAGGRLDAGVQS